MRSKHFTFKPGKSWLITGGFYPYDQGLGAIFEANRYAVSFEVTIGPLDLLIVRTN